MGWGWTAVGGRPCGTGRVPGMSCTGQSPLALWLGARGPEAGQLAAASSRSPAFRSVGLDGAQTSGVKGRLPQGGTRWGLPHAAGTPSRGRCVWVPQGEGSLQSLRTQSPWVRELGRTLFLTAPGCQGVRGQVCGGVSWIGAPHGPGRWADLVTQGQVSPWLLQPKTGVRMRGQPSTGRTPRCGGGGAQSVSLTPVGCVHGSSIHGILQARELEWVSLPSTTNVAATVK